MIKGWRHTLLSLLRAVTLLPSCSRNRPFARLKPDSSMKMIRLLYRSAFFECRSDVEIPGPRSVSSNRYLTMPCTPVLPCLDKTYDGAIDGHECRKNQKAPAGFHTQPWPEMPRTLLWLGPCS
uniref:Uncharacterized protein n=1 Tax=mine drainage metagenome TaxID=410659 RepID=E6PM80_9ZZZZ